jgi:hypothetical protein
MSVPIGLLVKARKIRGVFLYVGTLLERAASKTSFWNV